MKDAFQVEASFFAFLQWRNFIFPLFYAIIGSTIFYKKVFIVNIFKGFYNFFAENN